MAKNIPTFASDEDAVRFIETADLTEFDLSGFVRPSFEFESRGARVNMRLPESLLDAVKEHARAEGMPYQRFIRQTLERAVATKSVRKAS